ncbi:Spt20 family-domain-containing protein [Phaeosphaeriaceae sp. PMI808]|nr:Spt20 family-domain-containing protein [Phaeosphaeriaceae sp. PMI808]
MSGPIATARPSQALRLRRESQRPGVARAAARSSNMEDEGAKQDTKRYVNTQQDILARHRGKPPSIRIFLHQKHFRINDSPDMLEYSSPMREILQHVKNKTIPHNMVEDFYATDMPFYDNCLIVEISDFRNNGVKPRDDTNSLGDSGTNAFSIHNYNNFITPSPFAPYPSNNKTDAKPKPADAPAKDPELKEDKENMPAPAQNGASQKLPGKPKVWTTVLFPTPQSHLTDIQLLATTPVPDVATLKRMQAAGRVGGLPPTPMTAMPPTPSFPTGPSPKRQKMVLDDSNIYEFESEFYNATCPKLYLEPTKSFEESLALIDAVTHANNKNEAPARKTRKRTTAELQADEAEAAATQRFLLAGDEQQANMAANATGGDEGAARTNTNPQNFSRFKTLATIKAAHEESDRRKKEEDARVAQAKRQAQMEAEAQKRRDMETNRQQADLERQQTLLRQQAAQQQQLQQNQLQQNQLQQNQLQQNQLQQNQLQQNQLQQNQLQQNETLRAANDPNSPVSYATPILAGRPERYTNGSRICIPRVGGQVSHTTGGTSMVATASNHAIASPARPPSAISQPPMVRSVSQQQNMSRTGTPQMVQGTTPVMNTSMPNRNMTPTPVRMNQGSPSMTMQGVTPIMMQTPQPGQNMTPEHLQQLHNQTAMQQRMIQQQQIAQQQQQQQGASSGIGQLQQLAINKAQAHLRQNGIPAGQNPQHYQQSLARRFFQQLQQQQAQQQTQAAMQLGQQGNMQQIGQQNMGQQMSPQGSQQGMNPANMSLAQLRQHHNQRKMGLIQQFGQNIPQQEMVRLRQLEQAIMQRTTTEQNQQQTQMLMNNGMQGQMPGQMQTQMPNGVPNSLQTPMQMQQYQQLLQQQRASQHRQQQMFSMRQQVMQQGGQLPQGMMNNVPGINMSNMQNNMQNNMQGNMQGNLQGMNISNMQGMNMNNMQAMQGMNINAMNPQQIQQMMMMRQAQQQAQQAQQRGMGQPGQQGGGEMGWSG